MAENQKKAGLGEGEGGEGGEGGWDQAQHFVDTSSRVTVDMAIYENSLTTHHILTMSTDKTAMVELQNHKRHPNSSKPKPTTTPGDVSSNRRRIETIDI